MLQYFLEDRFYGSQTRVRPGIDERPKVSATSGRYTPIAETPDEFSEYEAYNFHDWDAAGAEPISAETLRAARQLRKLLPRSAANPDIAAGEDGSIAFEWRSGIGPDRTITYVEVGPGSLVSVSRFHAGAPTESWPKAPFTRRVHLLTDVLFPAHEPY